MSFVELKRPSGARFMIDFDNGWEVEDKGANSPASVSNHSEGRNLKCATSYEEMRAKLLNNRVHPQLLT